MTIAPTALASLAARPTARSPRTARRGGTEPSRRSRRTRARPTRRSPPIGRRAPGTSYPRRPVVGGEPPGDLVPAAPEDPGASRRFWFEHATGSGKTVAALGFIEGSR